MWGHLVCPPPGGNLWVSQATSLTTTEFFYLFFFTPRDYFLITVSGKCCTGRAELICVYVCVGDCECERHFMDLVRQIQLWCFV